MDVQLRKVKIVETNGSILTAELTFDKDGHTYVEQLDMDMDGNYADWRCETPPIEIGNTDDGWDSLIVQLDADPELQKAVEDYNER